MDNTDPRLAHIASVLAKKCPDTPFTITDILRAGDDSLTVAGSLGTREVVVKHLSTPDARDSLRAMREELAFVARHMGSGENRVMEMLDCWPGQGVILLAHAPGRPFGEELRAAPAPRRLILLSHAGRWLAAYPGGRTRRAKFGAGYWLEQTAALNRDALSSEDQALFDAVLGRMSALAETARDVEVVQAATHGDFVSFNMLLDGDTLWGVDIGGTSWQAQTLEAARFLVWEVIHSPSRADPRWFGLLEADVQAFLEGLGMYAASRACVLPFLTGHELLRRFIENYHRQKIAGSARAALHDYAS